MSACESDLRRGLGCDCLEAPSLWFVSRAAAVLLINSCIGADKSLARPGRKQATATEDFEFHISYL